MRLFLAINLEPSVRRAILEAMAPLRDAAPTLSWMDEARLHLTLKFFGEQDEQILEPLNKALDRLATRHKEFAIQLSEVGAFPNFRRARVVWLGVEREPRLELLHHDIEVGCAELGFELDGRPFRPHLTLARVRETTDTGELRRLSRASKRLRFEEESDVHSVDLMKSNLNPTAARYELLHAAPLRGH